MPSTPSHHLYLIGIGGVGMVWIADWALAQGWRVSGSDATESRNTKRLAAAGAQVHIGTDPAAIPLDITEVVVNSAITPSSPSYPELHALEQRGLPIVKRAVFVGRITRQYRTIAVAGTHGKTTTSAMIGWILTEAGYDPTIFTGGSLAVWDGVTRIGKSPFLVLEADEFDRSFHQFTAEVAVLLNIDADHTDYYTGGLPEIEHAFRRFLRNLPHGKGLVVGYGRDGRVRKVARGFKYRFRWYDEEHLWPGLKLALPGLHLRLNATAAARVAHEVGVDQETIKRALASFPGVGRRFEYLGTAGEVQVYDDYAHHPREVAATLQAVRERFPDQRLTVVFQPHQKARTRNLLAEFGRCFDASPPNQLILAPIYQVAGREDDILVTSQDIATEIAKREVGGMQVRVADSTTQLESLVREALTQPGVVLCMGAGDIRKLVESWVTFTRE